MTNRHTQKWVLILLVVLMTAPILTGCGKKGRLESPPGQKEEHPREYPTY